MVKQLLDPGSVVGEMIMKPTNLGDLKLASAKVVGVDHQELRLNLPRSMRLEDHQHLYSVGFDLRPYSEF